MPDLPELVVVLAGQTALERAERLVLDEDRDGLQDLAEDGITLGVEARALDHIDELAPEALAIRCTRWVHRASCVPSVISPAPATASRAAGGFPKARRGGAVDA
jgi:hypothetical protein